jgi:hypothetical protein
MPLVKSHALPTVAYLIEPRFAGGTSAAVAAELRIVAQKARVTVHAIRSRIFSAQPVAPVLEATLDELKIDLLWDTPTIGADLVILHNPLFLKNQTDLGCRIVARHLLVVTHENFLRPGGTEAFDVARCLGQIDRAATALRKSVAPISPHNRQTVTDWAQIHGFDRRWGVLDRDWFNICDFAMLAPTPRPADRRGRHSRPGFEKFPDLAAMDLCFPKHAATNVILGADSYLATQLQRPHWVMYPFQTIDVAQYLGMIDFMVYFTAPTWRESFGRVLAEAIAAGKVVITDAQTASTFGRAVIAATPAEVDAIIARHLAQPRLYQSQVAQAQASLASHSGAAFAALLDRVLAQQAGVAA